MIFDTNVLVALERESRRRQPGLATNFCSRVDTGSLKITPTIAGELACGNSMREYEAWQEILRPFEILPINEEAMWLYGVHYRDLQSHGKMIGSNDLWIAATALAHEMPIATNNVREFSRIEGLEVIAVDLK